MTWTSRASAAGRGAWERDAIFDVPDLSCRGCARHAEAAMRLIEGVRSARISFTAELAQIVYDARATSEREIAAAMGRAGFRLAPASGLTPERALRRGRLLFAATVTLLVVLLSLTAVRTGGAGQRWTGVARCALVVLILVLGVAPLVRQAAPLARRRQLARDALVISAALLALGAGVLELWSSDPAAPVPAWLASLGFHRGAWATTAPIGFELCGLIVILALCSRRAYSAARQRAAATVARIARDAEGFSWSAGAELAAASDITERPDLVEVRRALALVAPPAGHARNHPPRGGAMMRAAAGGEDFLDVAARALSVAAPAFAVFALLMHACLAGGPLAPAALLAPIAVLVGCSPAAFWFAAPAARALAIARARTAGIVVKDPRAIERVARTDVVCLEKTGAVTAGRPCVTGVRWLREPDRRLLEDVLALEERTPHPAGAAVALFLRAAGLRPTDDAVQPVLRMERGGVAGRIRGQLIEIGTSARWAPLLDRDAPPSASIAWFARNGEPFGYFELHHPLRAGVEGIVRALGERGLSVRILSGDRHRAARHLARRIGVQGFGDLSSAGKALHVRDLQHAGARVLFVGSARGAASVQADASVILSANVGRDSACAGPSADVGRDSACAGPSANPAHDAIPSAIVLTGDRFDRLAYLVDLSRALRARLREGVAVAAFYNALVIPLAALGICPPAATAVLSLVEALALLANALRLPLPPAHRPLPAPLRAR